MIDESAERECPLCKESIKAFAVICPYCQAGITPAAPNHGGVCPFCGEVIKEDALKCRHCKSDLLDMSIRSAAGDRAVLAQAGLPTSDLLACYQFCFLKFIGDNSSMTACMFGCDHHA